MASSNRSVANPPSPISLTVPDTVWSATLAEMIHYRTSRSECLVFWGGVITGTTGVVTGLYLPNHTPQGCGVSLQRDEARWLLRQLRERDEKLLAQVHSHPGAAYHSPGDNRHATSYHPGFYSIVVPHFGAGVTTPADCAIHIFNGEQFALCDLNTTRRMIAITPTIERRHLTTYTNHQQPTKRNGWQRWLRSKLRQKTTGHSRH